MVGCGRDDFSTLDAILSLGTAEEARRPRLASRSEPPLSEASICVSTTEAFQMLRANSLLLSESIFFRRWSARRFRRGGGFGAATVRPRTRLSRRGLRAFTERDGQESQRKTPPGCVSPPFVAEPRPRLDAPAPFPRNRRRRRRLRRESADDARASRAKTPTTRSSSRAAAVPRRRVAAGISSRAYHPSTVSIPRLSAPPPARHGRTPRRYSPTAALRRSCPIRHRQVLLPGEGAGLPLARVVQARAAEPQV